MPTVTEALERLNQADLASLQRRLDRLRADLQAALETPNRNAPTAADMAAAARQAGVSVEDFLAALEWARKL